MANSLRQQYIDKILSKKGANNKQEKAFLESLTVNELANMVDGTFEDEFELEGEIREIDFDIEEQDLN
jgi:hypothetical protein